ncbi:MAG: hypothetical protein OIF48_02690 [Silicimonas sp.]|nr:hypothetical protein [Silicimonas sp.]
MTGQSAPGVSSAPLGAGLIIGDSFTILFRYFVAVLLLAAIPTFIGLLISGLSVGWAATLGLPDAGGPVIPGVGAAVFNILIQIVVWGLTTALLVQLAYDAKLKRSSMITDYLGPALKATLPIGVLWLVASVLIGIASVALVIPGLWLYAVFSMIAPAVVIEGAGFRAMGRSADLTKGYRWPILGVMVVIIIASGLLGGVVGFIVGLVGAGLGGGVIVGLIMNTIAGAIGTGLGGISVALIYARLREIKEGVSVDQIASVFD